MFLTGNVEIEVSFKDNNGWKSPTKILTKEAVVTLMDTLKIKAVEFTLENNKIGILDTNENTSL